MKLALELDSERVAAGAEATGRVLVIEGGRSRSLTLTLAFRERTPSHVETVFGESRVLHEGDLATGQSLDFRLGLPDDAPPSAKGKHGELFWELAAVSDEPGLDTHVSRVLEVTR